MSKFGKHAGKPTVGPNVHQIRTKDRLNYYDLLWVILCSCSTERRTLLFQQDTHPRDHHISLGILPGASTWRCNASSLCIRPNVPPETKHTVKYVSFVGIYWLLSCCLSLYTVYREQFRRGSFVEFGTRRVLTKLL